jgi:hypothetical protein
MYQESLTGSYNRIGCYLGSWQTAHRVLLPPIAQTVLPALLFQRLPRFFPYSGVMSGMGELCMLWSKPASFANLTLEGPDYSLEASDCCSSEGFDCCFSNELSCSESVVMPCSSSHPSRSWISSAICLRIDANPFNISVSKLDLFWGGSAGLDEVFDGAISASEGSAELEVVSISGLAGSAGLAGLVGWLDAIVGGSVGCRVLGVVKGKAKTLSRCRVDKRQLGLHVRRIQ